MKRRSFNDRIQIAWLGKPSADRGKHPSVIPSDSVYLLSLINSESKRLESDVAKFDWTLLLPLIVVLGMARSSQVRTGYVDPTSPAFIEYLTALALKRADRSSLRPTINDAVKIRDRNERLFWSCNEYCSNELYNSEGSDETRWMLLVNARINYMLVRGETYEANFLDEAQQLFGTDATYLQTKFGFTVDQAIRYVNRILKLLNIRLFKQKEKLVAIFENLASTKVNSTVWPVGVNVRGPRRSRSPRLGDPLDTLPEFAKDLFLISEKELMAIVGPEEPASLSAFLNWISLSPGQVSGQFVSPLDVNPVQDAPVVKLGNDYLFHSSSYLARCLVYSLDKQIKRDHSHINSYNRKRSRYLEDESLQLFKKIFPNDTAYQRLRNCVAQDGRKINAELDGLVQHDNSLFLIECATHPVTLASKRGVKDSIIHDIEQSIQRTFKQAKRARDFIRGNDQAVFTLSNGSKITIDPKSVKNYFLVSVTLDSFDVFAADPRKLKGLLMRMSTLG